MKEDTVRLTEALRVVYNKGKTGKETRYIATSIAQNPKNKGYIFSCVDDSGNVWYTNAKNPPMYLRVDNNGTLKQPKYVLVNVPGQEPQKNETLTTDFGRKSATVIKFSNNPTVSSQIDSAIRGKYPNATFSQVDASQNCIYYTVPDKNGGQAMKRVMQGVDGSFWLSNPVNAPNATNRDMTSAFRLSTGGGNTSQQATQATNPAQGAIEEKAKAFLHDLRIFVAEGYMDMLEKAANASKMINIYGLLLGEGQNSGKVCLLCQLPSKRTRASKKESQDRVLLVSKRFLEYYDPISGSMKVGAPGKSLVATDIKNVTDLRGILIPDQIKALNLDKNNDPITGISIGRDTAGDNGKLKFYYRLKSTSDKWYAIDTGKTAPDLQELSATSADQVAVKVRDKLKNAIMKELPRNEKKQSLVSCSFLRVGNLAIGMHEKVESISEGSGVWKLTINFTPEAPNSKQQKQIDKNKYALAIKKLKDTRGNHAKSEVATWLNDLRQGRISDDLPEDLKNIIKENQTQEEERMIESNILKEKTPLNLRNVLKNAIDGINKACLSPDFSPYISSISNDDKYTYYTALSLIGDPEMEKVRISPDGKRGEAELKLYFKRIRRHKSLLSGVKIQ